MEAQNLSEELQSFRAWVNEDDHHSRLVEMLSRYEFNVLCAAMDVLGDTTMAIEHFLEEISHEAPLGEVYLRVYGILQVVVVQQDATKFCCAMCRKVFKTVEYKPSDSMARLCKLRVKVAGHPVRQERENGKTTKETKSHFLVRATLSESSFEILTFHGAQMEHEPVINLRDLIRNQEQTITDLLRKVNRA